jgi:hypothetical protein
VSSVNVSGQAYGFLAMTPIRPGEEQALRSYIEGFDDRGERPLARSARTHMARFVIVEDFNNDPSYKQGKEEHLADKTLIFSANFDGDPDSYLDELAAALADEAPQIWGRCIGCPDTPSSSALKAYLKHNQIDCGFFYAAYGGATVAKVQASLSQRDRLMDFATRAQGMSNEELQQAFVAEFAG